MAKKRPRAGPDPRRRTETERRLREAQLRITSQYARKLIEASLDPLVTISAEGKITDVNAATEAVTGVSRGDLIGSDFSNYFTEPDNARAGYRAVFARGTVRDYPLTIRHRSGKTTDVLYNATVYRDDRGEVQGVFAAARDVTALRQAESALQSQRKRFADVLEDLPVFTVLLTPDYHVRYANRRFREIFGEPQGRRCFESIFGLSEPCAHCQSFVTLETKAPHQWVWEDAKGRTYQIHDRPFTDADGTQLVLEMGIDITELKRAEERLQASSAYARGLIEASLDPLVTISAAGKITDVNIATETATGVPRSALIGSDFCDYFTEPDRARVGYQAVFAQGLVRDYPLTIRHQSGITTDVLYNATVYRDERGDVAGVFAAARDITERRRSEREIVRLNRLYGVLSRTGQAMVRAQSRRALLDEACRIAVQVGGFRLAWVGEVVPATRLLRPVAVFGEPRDYADATRISADDVPEGRGPTGSAFREGRTVVCRDIGREPQMAPWRSAALDAGLRSSAAFPLRVAGNVRAVFTVYSSDVGWFADEEVHLLEELTANISYAVEALEREDQQRAAEAALVSSETRFRSLIDNSSDLLAIVDPAGVTRFVSPSVRRILGYEPGEQIGHSALELVHPEDVARVREALEASVARGGGTERIECRVRHKDGSWRTIESVGTNLLNVPSVAGVVVNSRDITERVRLEQQLRQALKMDALGQLAGGIAHDFNNLLTVIHANVGLLETDLPEDDGVRQELGDLQRAATRGRETVKKLLGFSRQETLALVRADVGELIADFVTTLQRVLPETVEVKVTVARPLPAVRADIGSLEQILINLATNSRDAMPDGGTLSIDVAPRDVSAAETAGHHDLAPGTWVCVTVSDTGQGMDEQTLRRAFEPFFTTKPVGQGTGLGVSLVYGLMRQHGGHMHMTSQPGRGTTVRLLFPAVEGGPVAAVREPARRGAAGRGGTETILVVEDEPELQRAACRILERFGYRTLSAANGEEALATYREHRSSIDLVFTDLVMPKLGGVALLERVRAEDPGARFLVASGYTSGEARGAGMRAGVPFINKPWTLPELLERVRQALDAPAP